MNNLEKLKQELYELEKRRTYLLNRIKSLENLDCKHESYRVHSVDADNGYGKWWKVEIKTCEKCQRQNVYGKWDYPSG